MDGTTNGHWRGHTKTRQCRLQASSIASTSCFVQKHYSLLGDHRTPVINERPSYTCNYVWGYSRANTHVPPYHMKHKDIDITINTFKFSCHHCEDIHIVKKGHVFAFKKHWLPIWYSDNDKHRTRNGLFLCSIISFQSGNGRHHASEGETYIS